MSNGQSDLDMRDEYDFSKGGRGKYAAKFSERSVAVVLDPDVAATYSDSKSVNDALRSLGDRGRKQRDSA